MGFEAARDFPRLNESGAMKTYIVLIVIALAASISEPRAQQSASDAASSSHPPANRGLADLNEMTFDCPKAGLNAAAREAAKAPTQGTYQFSYFNIIHDAHHASYEVHFKSNYQGEPTLKYCVSMYCQQGWDPAMSKTEVTLMPNERRRRAKAHACGVHSAKRKS